MKKKQAHLRAMPRMEPESPAPSSMRYLGLALIAGAAISVLWVMFQLTA
jgi:hypothetical protein